MMNLKTTWFTQPYVFCSPSPQIDLNLNDVCWTMKYFRSVVKYLLISYVEETMMAAHHGQTSPETTFTVHTSHERVSSFFILFTCRTSLSLIATVIFFIESHPLVSLVTVPPDSLSFICL